MTKTMRATAMAVLLSFSSSFIVAPAHAAIVSTEEAVAMHQQDRSELKQFFDREDIAKALQAREGLVVAHGQRVARHDAVLVVGAHHGQKSIGCGFWPYSDAGEISP